MSDRKIDFEYLMLSWQDESPDSMYYLDTETGDVELVKRDGLAAKGSTHLARGRAVEVRGFIGDEARVGGRLTGILQGACEEGEDFGMHRRECSVAAGTGDPLQFVVRRPPTMRNGDSENRS